MKHRRSWHLGGIAAVAATVALAASACGGGSGAATPKRTTTTTAATTTTVAVPIAPLTGLPDPSGASLTRPALSVKVENTADARPQAGIDQADVVYEEVVEGNITRFVAIFNSAVPDVIGPVRSVRAEDPDIVWPLGGIFAYSGGAQVNVDAINAAPVHAVDEDAAGSAMVRNEPSQPPRDAPHNLYGLGPALVRARRRPRSRRSRCSSTSPTGVAGRHRPRRARLPRRLRRRATTRRGPATAPPTRGSGRSTGHPSTVAGRVADRAHQRGGAVHAVHAVRPRGRPSARATSGCSPTARCAPAGGCAPTRPSPPATSTPPASPILLRPGPHLGRAAAGRPHGRRDRRPGARHHGAAGDRRARPTTSQRKKKKLRPRSDRPVPWVP